MSAVGVMIAVMGAAAICVNAWWMLRCWRRRGERPDLLMLAAVSVAVAAPTVVMILLWCDGVPRVTIVYEPLPPFSR